MEKTARFLIVRKLIAGVSLLRIKQSLSEMKQILRVIFTNKIAMVSPAKLQ
jgi:hypothetical protein